MPETPTFIAKLVLLLAATAICQSAVADDAYFTVQCRDLKLTDGAWPERPRLDDRNYATGQWMMPRAIIDGGEAYVDFGDAGWQPYSWRLEVGKDHALLVRAESGKDVTGAIYVPKADLRGMVRLKFTIPASAAAPSAKQAFYTAKRAHYWSLRASGQAGAAWFRYQYNLADKALGGSGDDRNNPNGFNAGQFNTLDDTYNLFAGGRALSENLQLNRVIPAGRTTEFATQPLDKIPGVTTKELDWTPLIKGLQPATDPLAAAIPIDQHAVFFPSFAAMRTLVDEADAQGVPVLQALEPQSSDSRVKERYQRQLCLSFTVVGRILGPRLIDSVAITGSDGYMRVGSDVAVLFSAKDPAALKTALGAQLSMAQQREANCEAVEGKLGKLVYTGVRTPDRAVCSYLAQLGDSKVIVVTNSLKQLERLAAVHVGEMKPIGAAAEYTFFRDRYKRGEPSESAFVVLTDATIRRWCSARWRILDSRRTLAAAVMAELQAEHAGEIATRSVKPTTLTTNRHVQDMGELRMTAGGVVSSTYGSLEFMTPIVELTTQNATNDEVQLYARWRTGYEQNWSNFFDPIALTLSVNDNRLAADLTVMPLIAGSQYNSLIELTRGVKLAPDSADPHDALLHFAMALNRNSELVKQVEGFFRRDDNKLAIDPFAWVGKAVAIYVDDDPLWKEAAQTPDPEKFLQDNFHRIPVAIYIANESPLKLAAFMTMLRAYVDGSAPGTSRWETLEHNGRPYVRVSSKEAGDLEKLKIYYATTAESLILTPNENVLKRALDRQAARAAAKDGAAEAKAQAATRPAEWLGESASLNVDARALAMLRGIFGRTYQDRMREMSWSNLPILNEWKRLYPDQDPVKVHQRLWQVRLVDPAGGEYVWNEAYQTMESTTYGHPGGPKDGPGLPPQLDKVRHVGLGVTFENQGLRARGALEREKNP